MNYRHWIITIILGLALTACGGDKAAETAPEPAKAEHAGEHEEGHHEGHEEGHKEGGHDDVHEEHDDGHEEGHADAVVLSDKQLAAAGIEVEKAGPVAIREALALQGTVAPNGERVREVAARFPGVIRSVTAKPGDSVRSGALLATVESNESLETYRITAPIAGTVTARNANPGEQSGERALLTVTDLSTVWVEISLFPRDAARVRSGQSVRVSTPDGAQTAEGVLSYVSPVGSSASQAVTARLVLDNAAGHWAPGLYVKAEVALNKQQAAVAVRNNALHSFEGGTAVFERADAGFTARPVRTGRSDSQFTEILEGLSAGARYATRNSYVIKAEMSKTEGGHDH